MCVVCMCIVCIVLYVWCMCGICVCCVECVMYVCVLCVRCVGEGCVYILMLCVVLSGMCVCVPVYTHGHVLHGLRNVSRNGPYLI